ncbi:hypothetical protein CEXT_613951 [Caerostris extrusa]|uniref:Uncharacterized protein n=1 Tax=Caerostris extrusa TaxID=172846 RepID=A0AAV4XKW9_CAEEX|nr:hypothetical protein CEXT_613951 [Caerostris extrusa]
MLIRLAIGPVVMLPPVGVVMGYGLFGVFYWSANETGITHAPCDDLFGVFCWSANETSTPHPTPLNFDLS